MNFFMCTGRLPRRGVALLYPNQSPRAFGTIDIANGLPGDADFKAPVVHTPTFIVVDVGREPGRIEGWTGEGFFSVLLERVLAEQTDFPGSGRSRTDAARLHLTSAVVFALYRARHYTATAPTARPAAACRNAWRNEGTARLTLPHFTASLTPEEMDSIVENATTASNFLKAVSHEGRLMILCHLASGEKSVTELEELLSARQAAVSQQLSRLRLEGLVIPRREGKTIYYRLADDRPKRILELVYDLFCTEPPTQQQQAAGES